MQIRLQLQTRIRLLLKLGREELNGTIGVLEDFIVEKNRFAIALEQQKDRILVKPSHLAKPPEGR